jgi:putative membrane protein
MRGTMGELVERVKNIVIGSLIGMVSILPGISGAVIAAIFGVYERMVEGLGDLKHKVREDFWFLATLGIGLVIGAVIFSILYKNVIEPSEFYFVAIALFIGMIAGQLPDVYTIARSKGEPVRSPHILWFAIGFVAMMLILAFQLLYGIEETEWDGTSRSIVLMLIVGLIFSVGGLLPGFSAPTLILALGLMSMMTGAMSFSEFNMTMFLVFAVGVLVGVLTFSKIMDRTLKRHHTVTYFAVLGLISGSIFTIVSDLNADTVGNIVLCIAAGIAGFVISYVISSIGRKQRGKAGVSRS